MKRYAQEKNITERNWREHIRMHQEELMSRGQSPDNITCPCDKQKGRFRKKDAYDCGKSRCMICHYEKFCTNQQTRQVRKSNISFKEQKDDI